MTRKEIRRVREQVLAVVLLRLYRSRETSVALVKLWDLFEMERLPVAAKFFGYAGFSHFVRKHPSLTIKGFKKRGTSFLMLDTAAAMFVGSRTGESLEIDFEALRNRRTFRCMPIGDQCFSADPEAAA